MDGGQRVVAGVTGSVGNLQALRYAAAEARRREAPLLAAWRRLWDAFDAALGGLPPDLHVEAAAVRGDPGRVLVATAGQQDDLLVVGAGRRGVPWRLLRSRVSRYCLTHATCPVLVVPPSELAQEMEHRLHAWIVRHRSLLPGKNELSGHTG